MLIRTATFVFLIGCAGISRAGSFEISPVRVDLTEQKPNTSVKVTNTGDQAVTVQIHAAQWAMRGPENDYTETDDFIVNPPVVVIQPGRTQLVRIGLRPDNPAAIERSYRLFLEEVPKASQAGTIAIVLNISLPIFIQPPGPVKPNLVWGVTRPNSNSMQLAVRNEGSAHDRISSVSIETDAGKIAVPLSGYVLAGSSRDVLVRDDRLRDARRLELVVVSDAGSARIQLNPPTVASN